MTLTGTLSGLLIGFVSVAGPLPDGAQDLMLVVTSSSLAYGIASWLERDLTNRRKRRGSWK